MQTIRKALSQKAAFRAVRTFSDSERPRLEREEHEKELRSELKDNSGGRGFNEVATRGGVRYERGSSTKMRKGDVLCPDNRKLVEVLERYAKLQLARGNIDLADAYTMPAAGIIDNIRRYAAPITSSDEIKNLKLKFIINTAKTDLKDRLEELQLHGDIAELHEDPAVTARKLFATVPGLQHLADDFVLKGHRSIKDLISSREAGGWSEQQLRELQYYNDLRSKITCQEAVLMGMLLKDHLSDWNRDILIEETGTVRRRELWARESEMRFLITHPTLPQAEHASFFKEIVTMLMRTVNGGGQWEIWVQGGNSVILKARIPPVFSETRWRKVALVWVPYEEWVPKLLEYTGHERFTEKLAERAREKGWRLTPTAIYNQTGDVQVFDTEEAFFKALDEPFVPSWDRTEQGPQLNRRNNDFTFVGGEYKEKPRAHRVRNHKGRRPSFHELLRRRTVMNTQVDKNFNFELTNFENGFDKHAMDSRLGRRK
eukprot:TRINITY_DN23811_c0_g1_i1.p1 TRINITY_DN23811_c0_g1~~TRINITY_DN23811_c0_g1_i1.p1  ORF type:complete len:504 (+),score=100.11 TRINITY_DN23811_c0_g1_i1:57-1514(+)